MISTLKDGKLTLDATNLDLTATSVTTGTFRITIDVTFVNSATTSTIYITGNLKYCRATYPAAITEPILVH